MEEEKPHGFYTSRTKEGMCKNQECENKRRTASAYCKECSDKHKK